MTTNQSVDNDMVDPDAYLDECLDGTISTLCATIRRRSDTGAMIALTGESRAVRARVLDKLAERLTSNGDVCVLLDPWRYDTRDATWRGLISQFIDRIWAYQRSSHTQSQSWFGLRKTSSRWAFEVYEALATEGWSPLLERVFFEHVDRFMADKNVRMTVVLRGIDRSPEIALTASLELAEVFGQHKGITVLADHGPMDLDARQIDKISNVFDRAFPLPPVSRPDFHEYVAKCMLAAKIDGLLEPSASWARFIAEHTYPELRMAGRFIDGFADSRDWVQQFQHTQHDVLNAQLAFLQLLRTCYPEVLKNGRSPAVTILKIQIASLRTSRYDGEQTLKNDVDPAIIRFFNEAMRGTDGPVLVPAFGSLEQVRIVMTYRGPADAGAAADTSDRKRWFRAVQSLLSRRPDGPDDPPNDQAAFLERTALDLRDEPALLLDYLDLEQKRPERLLDVRDQLYNLFDRLIVSHEPDVLLFSCHLALAENHARAKDPWNRKYHLDQAGQLDNIDELTKLQLTHRRAVIDEITGNSDKAIKQWQELKSEAEKLNHPPGVFEAMMREEICEKRSEGRTDDANAQLAILEKKLAAGTLWFGEKRPGRARVFLSYSRSDSEVSQRLVELLCANGSIEVWYDSMLKEGAKWYDEILEKLGSSDLVVFLLSRHLLNSAFCTKESVVADTQKIAPMWILLDDLGDESGSDSLPFEVLRNKTGVNFGWLCHFQGQMSPLNSLNEADKQIRLESFAESIIRRTGQLRAERGRSLEPEAAIPSNPGAEQVDTRADSNPQVAERNTSHEREG